MSNRKTILYGVNGEGYGHCSRFLDMVRACCHEVDFVVITSEEKIDYLRERLPESLASGAAEPGRARVDSLIVPFLEFKKNKKHGGVDLIGTVPSALKFLKSCNGYAETVAKRLGSMRIDAVISDFEPISARVAGVLGVPLYSLDNQHRFKCYSPPSCLSLRQRMYWRAAGLFTSKMVPNPKLSVIPGFLPEREIKRESGCRSVHVSPFVSAKLEEERSAGRIFDDGHVACYVQGRDAFRVAKCIARAGYSGHVFAFGSRPTTITAGKSKIHIHPPSGKFAEVMCRSSLVIGGAGYQLISECLYLGKKMICMPMRNQTEQAVNAALANEVGACWAVSPADLKPEDIEVAMSMPRARRIGVRSGSIEAADIILGDMGL